MARRQTYTPNGTKIREIILDRGLTDTEVRNRAGICCETLRKATNGEKILQKSAVQIARALRCDLAKIVIV